MISSRRDDVKLQMDIFNAANGWVLGLQSHQRHAHFKEEYNILSLCVCVCVPHKQFLRNLMEVTIVKFGTVTASDMRMHHMLIILTLNFI